MSDLRNSYNAQMKRTRGTQPDLPPPPKLPADYLAPAKQPDPPPPNHYASAQQPPVMNDAPYAAVVAAGREAEKRYQELLDFIRTDTIPAMQGAYANADAPLSVHEWLRDPIARLVRKATERH